MKQRQVILVTSNVQKAHEIAQALKPYGIKVVRKAIDLDELQADDIATVVKHKAEQAFALVKAPVIVDDTGIYFKGFKRYPGVYSKHVAIGLGFKGLSRLITSGQGAEFVSYIAFKASAKAPVQLFKGSCRGTLINVVRGKKKRKMPYDNLFIPTGDTLTFAQMGVANKQKYDHRSKAVRKFAKYYANVNL